jgi:hypothetical protein
MKTAPYFLAIVVSVLIVAAVPAQTTTPSSTPATNISNQYSYFLKNVNSQQVVNDLRNGQWTTTTIDPQTNTTIPSTQPLPTGKMGYGNVKISLALAQQSLSQQGITQPTSQQLYTALAGGQMTPGGPTTTGILQMRADGMGWGQIAQQYNIKLGQLMSGKQPASATTSTTTTTKGITTASGNSSSNVTGKGNGNTLSGSKSQGSGIVSASGRSAGTYSSPNGSGIVSGSGRSMGQPSGLVTGAGNGNQYGASGGSHGSGGGAGMGHSR